MSHEHIAPADLRYLKTYDVLQAYCERMLPPVRKRGNVARCACPFGAHSRPDHLELAVRDGVGVALCRACGTGGSVLDVAAAMQGVDLNGHFAEVVRHVADVTGYTLRDTSSHAQPQRGRRASGTASEVRSIAARIAQQKQLSSAVPSPAPPPALEFLPAEDEAMALASVRYASKHSELMVRHAEAMQLPLASLMLHTDMELAMRGLLGLAPDGRLLYVYTVRDEAGRGRVVAVKLRGSRHPEERKLYIRHGAWQTGGLMRYDNGEPIRFMFAAGRPCALYGVDELEGHYMAFLTEGESDKLALDSVLEFRREAYQTGIDSPEDYIPEEEIPVAVAKAGAGGFKPEWAGKLAGLAVVIIADRDEAGRKGAQDTARILHEAGARDVYMWQPPEGYKDARAMVAACSPQAAYNNILNQMTLIQ